MKKSLLICALVVLMAVPAMARIKETKHNLGTTGDYTYRGTTGTTQICMFCHTPHNPVQNIPIWNRNNPTSTVFRMYSGSTSLNRPDGALTPDSVSRFCLSCHDGNTSITNIKNVWAGETLPAAFYIDQGAPTNIGGGDGAGITADLSNDHPVNFDYSIVQTSDPYFKAQASTGLRFFRSTGNADLGKISDTDYLECASCHDPHGAIQSDGTYPRKFLRKRNDSSSLCLSCHVK